MFEHADAGSGPGACLPVADRVALASRDVHIGNRALELHELRTRALDPLPRRAMRKDPHLVAALEEPARDRKLRRRVAAERQKSLENTHYNLTILTISSICRASQPRSAPIECRLAPKPPPGHESGCSPRHGSTSRPCPTRMSGSTTSPPRPRSPSRHSTHPSAPRTSCSPPRSSGGASRQSPNATPHQAET